MSTFVESLKRLYDNQLITDEKLLQLLEEQKITDDEYEYILK